MVDTMSEKSVEIVAGLVTKQGVTGRRTYSAEAKRALVELCTVPGVSVAAMALQHGVNANLLRRWIMQYLAAKPSGARPAASGKSAATLLAVTTPLPKATRTSISPDSYVEIIFVAATIRVHGAVDARVLSVVLDCLAQRA
jgi:transposase